MKATLLIFFASLATHCWGQSSVNGNIVSAYAESATNSYAIRWTIGELIPETFVTNTLTVGSGFLFRKN